MIRQLLNFQIRVSERLEGLLPEPVRIDGNYAFITTILPQYIAAGSRIYDVGGGKHPALGKAIRSAVPLEVIGFDVDPKQLEKAPIGAYDSIICADITVHRGNADGDMVICQALLEHVVDTSAAFRAIASLLKPGGVALIFVPCRNALFARLNLLTPEWLKRSCLYAIYPATRSKQGFRAHYDKCTPRQFRELANECGFTVEREYVYFRSGYLFWCVPLYIIWRMWVLLFRLAAGDSAAETFSMVLRKRGDSDAAAART